MYTHNNNHCKQTCGSCKLTFAHTCTKINNNVHRSGHCCTTGYHGDCSVVCDNVALESKFPVDIIDY